MDDADRADDQRNMADAVLLTARKPVPVWRYTRETCGAGIHHDAKIKRWCAECVPDTI